MIATGGLRRNEVAVVPPPPTDAGLVFIGRIHTPWPTSRDCPRRGHADGPVCRIELFEPWVPALDGIEEYDRLEVLYWLHESRRDLVWQSPKNNGETRGTFSIRSPVRPNPIGTSIVSLLSRRGAMLEVRGLDCIDGTPLLDLKPERTANPPLAAPRPADIGNDETTKRRNEDKGEDGMKVIKAATRATKNAPASNFIGTVFMDEVVTNPPPSRLRGLSVTFTPGARTNWHTHPVGQTLYVVYGTGRIQKEGEPPIELTPGDTVMIPPNVKHWHGAAPDRLFTHIALQEEGEGGAGTVWLEPVSDADYRATPVQAG